MPMCPFAMPMHPDTMLMRLPAMPMHPNAILMCWPHCECVPLQC